jgi:Thiamine pyrophosphate enzyme, N-terminal TPP binding domain
MYTTSAAMLSALREAAVQYLFVNLGSDHSAFMEAYAIARAARPGEQFPCPEVITCLAEMVALSAAHGHAAVSGRAQAVLVHVECGTPADRAAGQDFRWKTCSALVWKNFLLSAALITTSSQATTSLATNW